MGFSGPPINPPEPSRVETHEHEWEDVTEVGGPIFQDGAAIFQQRCMWVEILGSSTSSKHDETFYKEGAECNETRSYRMEESSITKLRDDEPDITYVASAIDDFPDIAEEAELAVMQDGEIVSIDPDKDYGRVVVRTDDWEITYKA